MKKALIILMTFIMVFSFASCGQPGDQGSSGDENDTIQTDKDPDAAASSPASVLLSDFKDIMEDDPSASVEDIAATLIENDVIPFAGTTSPVEPGFLTGFSEDITGFAEGCFFGPAISTIPFVGYIFRLDDSSKTYDFMKDLKGKADLRWNICTQADEMKCDSVGDTVFFVMSPAEFEE